MKNLKVQVEGLTFVSHGKSQMTVWTGEPGESQLIEAVAIGVMEVHEGDGFAVMGQVPEEVVDQEFDEGMLQEIARQWLTENPQHRPVTDAQKTALGALDEVIKDVCGDREIMGHRAVLLDHSPAVKDLVMQALATLRNTVAEKARAGQLPTQAYEETLVEMVHGTFTAGFNAGIAFERRGYRL